MVILSYDKAGQPSTPVVKASPLATSAHPVRLIGTTSLAELRCQSSRVPIVSCKQGS